MSQFTLNEGAELSGGILTLTDDQYADIPASILGDWPGTEGFELSVEIKAASGSNVAEIERGVGALIQRASSSSSGHGPMVFLWNDGSIQVRVHKNDKLYIEDAVASWNDWVKLKFVLNASATPKTLKVFVNDEEKGSRDLTRWDDYVDIVDTLTAASMRLGGNWSDSAIQNLNAQIRNLYISGVSSLRICTEGHAG